MWFIEKIRTTIDGITSINITTSTNEQTSTEEGTPINPLGVTTEKDLLSMDEASQMVKYPINMPSYVPLGFMFDGIYIDDPQSISTSIEIHFSTADVNDKLIVTQIPTTGATSFSHNVRGSIEEKTIAVNGSDATLIVFEDRVQMIWQYKTFVFIISGNINEEEIIKMAESII
ncbi:DUF4367 domain-containing protein [Desulfitibacter alkalitolerans]|uniref:DUF4367 domain-containing protein n=1 Tax=Desulfitibacter alkalitolerans TaxID=264641 RepID=UPI00047F3138|nr:DUF4367 domain-containing protein [Desulfitibacter alkalitolerans]